MSYFARISENIVGRMSDPSKIIYFVRADEKVPIFKRVCATYILSQSSLHTPHISQQRIRTVACTCSLRLVIRISLEVSACIFRLTILYFFFYWKFLEKFIGYSTTSYFVLYELQIIIIFQFLFYNHISTM